MDEILSLYDLEKILEKKPAEWGQILAYRSLLRSYPKLALVVTNGWKVNDGFLINHSKINQVPIADELLGFFHSFLITEKAIFDLPVEIKIVNTAIKKLLRPNWGDRFLNLIPIIFSDLAAFSGSIHEEHRVTLAYNESGFEDLRVKVALHNISSNQACFRIIKALNRIASQNLDILKQDIQTLEEQSSLSDPIRNVQNLSLWQSQQNYYKDEWRTVKQYFLLLDNNWQFWIDWYQSKLNGTLHPGLTQSQQEDLYYQIATFPNELWEEGAEAVNRRIAELMEEIKKSEVNDLEVEVEQPFDLEIPPQNKGALQFKTNEDGIIELDQEAIENELLNDQDAIDRHNEVDYLANELISSYDPNSSSANAARPIVTKVQRYLEALGDTPEETNINFIIPRGEVLRQELEREENRDEFTNSPPLPDEFKSSLASLVSAHNLYVVLDPVLDKRDQARLGPDAKENLVSKEEGLKFVDDAFNEGLIEEEIVETFHEEAETVHETTDPDRRQDRRFSESIKNLSRLLLSNTQKIAKKIKENQVDIIEVATASGIGAGSVLLVTNATWTIIGGALGVGVTCFKGLQWLVKK